MYTRAPVTKIVNSETKKPKPQIVVISPTDMTGAHSDLNNQRIVTTYRPNFVPNVQATYAAPVTTFHPKIPVQSASTFNQKTPSSIVRPEVLPSVSRPKSIVQTIAELSPTTITIDHTPLIKGTDKFSSHYRENENTKPFTTSSVLLMRPNVKDLLATIGLQPETSAVPEQSTSKPIRITTTTTSTPKPELTPELAELLKSFGLLTNEEPPAHITAGPYQDEFRPIIPSSLKDDTFHVNEFKPLPVSLASTPTKNRINDSPDIRSDDFSAFKPLPIPEDGPIVTDAELEELLKSYGLREVENSRGQKSYSGESEQETSASSDSSQLITPSTERLSKLPKMLNVPEVNVEFLSPDLMQVLKNMGVSKNVKSTKLSSQKYEATTVSYSSSSATSKSMENDYAQLHHLLDTIKQLDSLNVNLTEDELDSLNLNRFNFSDEILAQGPDPLDDYYTSNVVRQNEIKRRQSEGNSKVTESPEPLKFTLDLSGTSSSTLSSLDDDFDDKNEVNDSELITTLSTPGTTENDGESDSESESDTTTATSTTELPRSSTEESRNGDVKDLADSFGGGDGLDPVSDESLPAPKRNGFYFFSDWNSFLEVGEDPDKVIVRFDPKVGDPRPFIPVKIP